MEYLEEDEMMAELRAYWADCDARGVCRLCNGIGLVGKWRYGKRTIEKGTCTDCGGTGKSNHVISG